MTEPERATSPGSGGALPTPGPSTPGRYLRTGRQVASAAIVGVVQVSLAVSYAALVFSGDLAPFVGRGVGFLLFTAATSGIVVAMLATVPGTVGNAKGIMAALVAGIAGGVSAAMPAATAEARFVTVVAAIGVTSLVTGIFLLALGRLRLGNLVRILPYPVVGGFVAGTGWLLAVGALELLSGARLAPSTLVAWSDPTVLPQWTLGLLIAIVLMVVSARLEHPLAMPATIASVFGLFVAWVWMSGASIARLQEAGWLLGPFPDGGLWRPDAFGPLSQVDWSAIGSQAPAIGVVCLIAAMEVLLNATGMEVELRDDIDLDRELRTAGMASLASGTGGGVAGYQVLSLTLLASRLGGGTRIAALLTPGIALVSLVVGSAFLELMPMFVLGGLMAYTGLQLIKTWIVDARAFLPPVEYVVVIGIAVSIASFGILTGVAAGLLASIVLFAFAYSRIDVVRHDLTAEHSSSRVTWTRQEREALAGRTRAIGIVHLQGYLFFGTGQRLPRHVASRLRASGGDELEFLVLDFRRVSGMDATATFGLRKLDQIAARHDVQLVFAHVSPAARARLRAIGLTPSDRLHFADDVDRGLEFCERALLRASGVAPSAQESSEWPLDALDMPADGAAAVSRYFERRELAAGDVLMAQGDPAEALYVVGAGSLTAQLEQPGASPLRLETVGPGRVLGELGFFLHRPRSASVVADEASVIYALNRKSLDAMTGEEPDAALALLGAMTRLLSDRVSHLVGVVGALER